MQKTFRLIAVSLAVVMALASVLAVTTLQNARADAGSVSSVTGYVTRSIFGAVGFTQTATSTINTLVAPYGVQDCYETVAATNPTTTTLPQTVTLSIQHSADQTNWITLYTFPQITNAVQFTRTLVYGGYERAVAVVSNTVTVNVGLSCVLKNNGG
jgi:hypothetical protein